MHRVRAADAADTTALVGSNALPVVLRRAKTLLACSPILGPFRYSVGRFVMLAVFCQRDVCLNAPSNGVLANMSANGSRCSIYFHTVLLATFDERDYIIQS